MPRVQRLTVIGGGYIGMEMSEALSSRGIDVTILHRHRLPMAGLEQETREQILKAEDVVHRWMDVGLVNRAPMRPELSGLEVEYRPVQIYCADRTLGGRSSSDVRGASFKREARLSFNVGQGSQDIGFRNDVTIVFNAQPKVRKLRAYQQAKEKIRNR